MILSLRRQNRRVNQGKINKTQQYNEIHGDPLISRNALSQITKNNNDQFPEYMEKSMKTLIYSNSTEVNFQQYCNCQFK